MANILFGCIEKRVLRQKEHDTKRNKEKNRARKNESKEARRKCSRQVPREVIVEFAIGARAELFCARKVFVFKLFMTERKMTKEESARKELSVYEIQGAADARSRKHFSL